jgi:hypothetical protein
MPHRQDFLPALQRQMTGKNPLSRGEIGLEGQVCRGCQMRNVRTGRRGGFFLRPGNEKNAILFLKILERDGFQRRTDGSRCPTGSRETP